MAHSLRELGLVSHASTGIYEQSNKRLKLSDRLTRRDTLDSRHNDDLYERHSLASIDAADVSLPSASRTQGGGQSTEFAPSRFRGTLLTAESQSWKETLAALRNGTNGVPLPSPVVDGLHDAIRTGFTRDAPDFVGPGGSLHVASQVEIALSGTLDLPRQRLLPGHAVTCPGHGLCQILAIVATGDSRRVSLFLSVFESACPRRLTGKHPEVGLAWLQRSAQLACFELPLGLTLPSPVRRAHVVRCHANTVPAHQRNRPSYFHNTAIFYYAQDRGEASQDVYLSCPGPGQGGNRCTGRLLRPAEPGGAAHGSTTPATDDQPLHVKCPMCLGVFPWL